MTYKCLRCGHHWESRTDKPKACPRCKSYKFDVKPTPKMKPEREIEKIER
jgi:DNA-directed RNA polymerase subunit RPC12/RpoP